ncbi:MAG TPA: bifunctional enoyl-CoA hydratase/phosphate acetyltransferase [Candidatus Hydrogenedentes bacterium]|nr:bifunctional enoyl-CoA hydratase/phosphate acetyltransferase [Candidatus Hydrogenedentota bacterium]
MTRPPVRSFDELVRRARRTPAPRMAVAAAGEAAVLVAAANAMREGLVRPVLIGEGKRIRAIAEEHAVDLHGMDIVEALDTAAACAMAVQLMHEGEAGLVMKGLVTTKDFVRAILNHEFGLRRDRPLSHVAVIESPDRSRLMLLTDSGINIRPRFNRKVAIVRNALDVAGALGIEKPKVAIIAAVETVQLPAMPATIDAELLRRMGEAGHFGRCIVDGPLSMDNALDRHTAEVKGRLSPVAGCADVLVAPDIETANAIYKTVRYLARRELASIVVGAAGPAVVASRSDSADTKLYSIALGALFAARTSADSPLGAGVPPEAVWTRIEKE